MTAIKLAGKRVENVWGSRDVPEIFGGRYGGAEPLGQICFEHPGGRDVALLVKYLFTSRKTSIQVHPDDDRAIRAGHARGKDEAWLVLRAEPDAVIGLGFREPVSREALREAALDGSIEDLIDWRPVRPGDFYYSPAGTVHAIGPGLVLVEIQQNVDLTYRLYDYGRPRELHLEQGLEASRLAPYVSPAAPCARGKEREILAQGRAFVLERWMAASGTLAATSERPAWLVPVSGVGSIDGEPVVPGSVWLADGSASFSLEDGSQMLVAYPGGEVQEALIG